jgi:hypothetical protein
MMIYFIAGVNRHAMAFYPHAPAELPKREELGEDAAKVHKFGKC